MDTRFPRCKDSAVGSYPQYTLNFLSYPILDFYF